MWTCLYPVGLFGATSTCQTARNTVAVVNKMTAADPANAPAKRFFRSPIETRAFSISQQRWFFGGETRTLTTIPDKSAKRLVWRRPVAARPERFFCLFWIRQPVSLVVVHWIGLRRPRKQQRRQKDKGTYRARGYFGTNFDGVKPFWDEFLVFPSKNMNKLSSFPKKLETGRVLQKYKELQLSECSTVKIHLVQHLKTLLNFSSMRPTKF